MALGAAVTVVALMPVFLTSAMAVQMTRDLAFGSAGLGLAVAAFRSGGALTSVFLGRLTDQLGAIRTIRLAAAVATLTTLGIATTARGLLSLVLWLAVGGSALALAQPGANRLLMNVVGARRLGTAFGLKQSAPPIASMLSGAAVPLIAITVGWRWGFALAAIAAVGLMLGTTSPPPKPPGPDRRKGTPRLPIENRGMVILLAIAFGLGTSTSSSVTTFYVVSASAAGSTSAFAGTMFAVASVASIASRVLSGVLSDRLMRGHLTLCAVQLAIGAVGITMLATGTQTLMSAGVFIALIGCWGFNGVFWFALVRAYSTIPGRITGVVSPGGLMGSTLGPLIFGVLVDRIGFGPSWLTMSIVALIAAGVMLVGDRQLTSQRS